MVVVPLCVPPGLPDAFAGNRPVGMAMEPPGTVVRPPAGVAMRSKMVCMGWVPLPVASRGPASRGATTMPGGKLGTKYVTRVGGPTSDDELSRTALAPAWVTVPEGMWLNTTDVPAMLTRVVEGLDADCTCTNEVGAALSTGMDAEETAPFCNAVPVEKPPPAEKALA